MNGFDLLRRIVCHVSLPANAEEELNALRVLRHLRRGDPLPATALEKRNELYHSVELLGKEDVIRLIEWITPERHGIQKLAFWKTRRQRRLLLLFVLLAEVVASVLRFKILLIFDELGYLGFHGDRYSLLSWIPTRWPLSKTAIALYAEYLSLSREVIFEPEEEALVGEALIEPDEFARWPWVRQISLLQARRAQWALGRDLHYRKELSNPIFCSHTLEFALAHAHAFSTIAWRGGPVARHALGTLGYRDAHTTVPGASVTHLIAVTILILLAAVLANHSYRDMKNWCAASREALRTIAESTQKEAGK